MSYIVDAGTGDVPVFGNDLTIETADAVTLSIIVQDISNIEYTGERVTAKDGDGKDVARIYFNRDWRAFTVNGWPVGADETAAIAVDVLFKHGTILKTTSTRHPQLNGLFWRVTQAQKTASNTDKVMVSLGLEESISQAWPA